ncbi:MAG TPA: TatD family hydrolase [Tepidisphaeraceae bacterium]|nr:TatD family hydrolase [Tepidisphaeraceae bacterium]
MLDQLPDVLSRAASAGVERIITIGTDIEDDQAAIALCQGRPNLRCVIGIHPNYSHEAEFEDLARLRQLQRDPSVVALGETGLDYFHNFADRNRQRQFFEAQLQMARELNRPVVLHSREAIDDTLAILKNFPEVPALFHSFTGTLDESKRIADAGYLIGFTGPVTFKKNDALREAARNLPRDRAVVETDAPYLTPEPMRKQKTNEPAMVIHVAAAIAKEWGMTAEEADRITTANAERFFRL